MPSRSLLLTLILTLAPGATTWAGPNDQNLPRLGDSTSGIISLEQERKLGQEFLRSLRAQAPTVADPLLKDYLEHLIYRLASHSKLQDRRLDLIIIDNAQLNAFAVPGGVVGINKGMFLYAENEHEFSSILAHELAHLSQRHFARQVESGRKTSITSLAGLLAGIVLIATGSGDAGMAALSTSQAAAQSQTLRYSRSREAEADRVGIDTLAEADMNPRAMAHMFERLDRANRYVGEQIPEFLRTHPVTKSRISDSYNQARTYPDKEYPLSLDYQMMRNRVTVMTEQSPVKAIEKMKVDLDHGDPVKRVAARYGLVLALTANGEMDEAMRALRPLEEAYPGKIAFTLAKANVHNRAERYDQALAILEDAVRISPDNYPLTMALAETLLKDGQPERAGKHLVRLSQSRPNDQDVWYLLAETWGLARNIIGVHQARAEYFVLNGDLDQAIRQLGYALPLAEDDFQTTAKIRQRIEEIHRMRQDRI